ncbi:YccV-like-domain-containing protein [Byssothecium circinans]|uniref:YccV-like-domain-containing protein n=1 Tax=Byssothecium circinans TaxID=147558 RepID=A0A6A5U133_9PLEO|nr:YccV-like-domain-containing protein [Byssothecium circinans]
MTRTFVQLPTELLEAIFFHLEPQSLLSVSQTNRFINSITHAPSIWRNLCQKHYQTWAPHHDIAAKLTGPLSSVDWRSLFVYRVNVEREALRLLNCILESPTNRIRHINQIADFGYDVKETLLKQLGCPDDAEDVLARRYYAKVVLERIQRDMSISVWRDLLNGEDVPIEIALGAYDMFTRIGPDVEFETITTDLDQLAAALLKQHPGLPECDTRSKACTVASFLREQGFNGVSDALYEALRNSFIGFALHSQNHESLPLISVAIFCALARQVGLDARPCAVLSHVYCIVHAPKNYTLDGDYKPTSTDELHTMYLDPFRTSSEIPSSDLHNMLREIGIPTAEHGRFLAPTDTRNMVLRTARNIMNSVQIIRGRDVGTNGINSTWRDSYPDIDASFYAAVWSMTILGPREGAFGGFSDMAARRRQYLPYLIDHLRSHHPWDVTLFQRYVLPFFDNERERERLERFGDATLYKDGQPRAPKPRDGNVKNVLFRVGQLFKHKRYFYEGIITGWDVECDAGEEWIQNMGVDRLSGGRHQAFYHVLVSDKSVRYVAEENISHFPETTEPTPAIMMLAGRHFKRWDGSERRFVSNVRDEYPDD